MLKLRLSAWLPSVFTMVEEPRGRLFHARVFSMNLHRLTHSTDPTWTTVTSCENYRIQDVGGWGKLSDVSCSNCSRTLLQENNLFFPSWMTSICNNPFPHSSPTVSLHFTPALLTVSELKGLSTWVWGTRGKRGRNREVPAIYRLCQCPFPLCSLRDVSLNF